MLLLGCLEPVPEPPPGHRSAPIDVSIAVNPPGGSTVARGRISGTCGGVVRVELVGRAGDALARTEATGGGYLLGPIDQPPAAIRWGCDADRDGTVAGAHVVSANIGQVPLSGAVLVLPAEGPATR